MAIGKLPFPVVAPPPTPMARRLGRTFTNGESSGLTASVTPPGPHRRRNVKASAHKNRLIQGCGKVAKLLFAGEPIDAGGALARPDRATASSGSRISNSPASVHGGLITIRPHAPSLVPARGAATVSSARKILGTPLRRKRRASASGPARSLIGYHAR